MAKYGQTVRLTPRTGGEAVERRAFLQPILKQRDGLPAAATPLGAVSVQRWLYIGRGGDPLSPGDRVIWRGRTLRVQEASVVCWRDEPLYCRALLAPGKEIAE